MPPSAFHGMFPNNGDRPYYQCPDCGFKQKSNATKRITCHRCGRSYQRAKAKKVGKQPDEKKGTGFFKYSLDADKDS